MCIRTLQLMIYISLLPARPILELIRSKVDQKNSVNQDKSQVRAWCLKQLGVQPSNRHSYRRASAQPKCECQRHSSDQHKASMPLRHQLIRHQGMPPGPARAWSHQEAMAEAARSYGAGGHNTPGGPPAPFSQGQNNAQTQHSHPPMGPGQGDIQTAKMPIPKFLPNPPPQPVPMGPSRPTYSGGASNSATGMMSQPAFQKSTPVRVGRRGRTRFEQEKA